MKGIIETVATVVLAICAAVVTGMLVRREFFQAEMELPHDPRPIKVENLEAYLAAGVRIGPVDAPLQLIEFGDYECPYCAQFHRVFESFRNNNSSQVALTYVHYPLPSHQFAESAAHAAECAGAQERFESMHDQLFQQQDRLGIKSMMEFARESGVPNLELFESCMNSNEPLIRIEQGKALAVAAQVRGTPTVILNGRMLPRAPNESELNSVLQSLLGGKDPFE